MVTWNIGGLKVFNDSTITQSSTKREYARKRLVARSSEARRQLTVRRYFSVSLAGLIITGEQLDEIRAFEAATANTSPFLVRLSTFHLFENHNGAPAFLGVGNGSEQTFQLTKTTSYQGDTYTDIIHYPNDNYPAMRDLNHDDWTALPPVRIYRGNPNSGGIDITSDCVIDRLTGEVTTAQNGALYVKGGFYWKMICPTPISVTPIKGGYFEIDSGVQFVEPFPDGGEVSDD
jgi:hypothetical protein